MGMFDYIRCEHPLPGNAPTWAQEFQTKDLACCMNQYVITADGQLKGGPGEGVADFTGTVHFYTSNVVASGPGPYTRDGEDAQWVDYSAVFANGKLSEIKEIENRTERAAKHKPVTFPALTVEDRKRIKQRRAELLTGRRQYVKWGGNESAGYEVTVIAENRKVWVVQAENGDFEIIDRLHRDSILFDSSEDSQAYDDERKADRDRRKLEYEAAKNAGSPTP